MASELPQDIDPKYLIDNLLLTEDWDLQKVDADLSQFLDIESALNHDDLISHLPEDLEIPMLDDASLYGLGGMPLDEGSHLSDSSDSGLSECFPVKEEPLSPAASHYSDNSEDSLNSQIPMDCSTSLPYGDSWGQLGSGDHFLFNQAPSPQQTTLVKYESPDTPPQTPPRDLSIVAPGNVTTTNGSLRNAGSTTCITMPTTSMAIRKHSVNSISVPNSANTIKLVIPAQGSNAAVNLTRVINGVPGARTGTPLSQVLNAKVKIQPRPAGGQAATATSSASASQGSSATTTTTTTLTPGKPLVLTPAEFAKLTAQGVLKFNAPATTGSKPTVTVKSPTTVTMGQTQGGAYSPGSVIGHAGEGEVTAKLVKRQQRMIKNRESACLSRKRKKEYMSKLEDKLSIFNMENDKLRQENQNLKRKVEILQLENVKLRKVQPGFGSMKKGATLLLGIMLLLSLNLGPLTSILQNGGPPSGRLPAATFHSGRTLLAFNENTEDAPERPQVNIPDIPDVEKTLTKPLFSSSKFGAQSSSTRRGMSSGGHLSRELMLIKQMEDLGIHKMAAMCPTYFNTTDSMRVLQELKGWVMGHEQNQQREQERFQPPKKKSPKKYYTPRKLKAAMKGGLRQYSKESHRPVGQYEVQVVSGERHYNQLMDQLHRRNDTFYVVSFRRDHFLLPATDHNKTTRPRMSLVMPAIGLNETMQVPDGSIPMMQIDCEVTHTKLVHIQESAVPNHLKENTTHHPVPDTDRRDNYRNNQAYDWP